MRIRRFEGGPFAENTYLLDCPDTARAILVDPGYEVGRALDAVRDEALDLVAVVLTHAHLDHVDGLPGVRAAFPEIPIHLHEADLPLYQAAPQQAAMFGMPVPDLPSDTIPIVPGEPLDFGGCLQFEVRFAPGHAPGHVILVATAQGEAIVGDVVFAGSIGRTDLPGGSAQTLLRSIHEQVLTLPDPMVLHPGHGPSTTVGRERLSNPFLQGGNSRFV